MRYLLALDQGTTSSRALLFDERAALLRMAQEEHPQIYPSPAGSSTNFWQTQVRTARWVLTEHAVTARDRAIGITNLRAAAGGGTRAHGPGQDRPGLLLDPCFSATKLARLLARLPVQRT
ncbi:MAG: FGGY family carbohydrate kinase [Gammaproteobacteria bacterium]